MSTASKKRYLQIKMCLLAKNTSFSAIARELHVHPSMVSKVAHGMRVSRRIRQALARACGTTYKELWEEK